MSGATRTAGADELHNPMDIDVASSFASLAIAAQARAQARAQAQDGAESKIAIDMPGELLIVVVFSWSIYSL